MEVTTIVKHTEKEAFEKALELVFMELKGNKSDGCMGYNVKANELFLSSYSDKCEKFPYLFNLQQTIDFAWGWYEHNKKPSGSQPLGDGSSEIAFEVSTERCGCGSDDWGMFVSIKPIWFYYGK